MVVWDTGSLCVRVVRLPGLWDLALQRQDSTLSCVTQSPKLPEASLESRLHKHSQFSLGIRTPATVLYWLVLCSRRPVYLLGQAVSGHLALART